MNRFLVLLASALLLNTSSISAHRSASIVASSEATISHIDRTYNGDCLLRQGKSTIFVGNPECFEGIRAHKMQGIWVVGMEMSFFVENADKLAVFDSPYRFPWIYIDQKSAFRTLGYKPQEKTHQFAIEFIGRESNKPGVYGHMGQYSSGIVVDKILKIRLLRSQE